MKPTDILMAEHRLILGVLDCLEVAADRLDSGEDVDAEFFLDAAEFVAGFADRCHHGKEEDILFTAMTARDMPHDGGPVAVMLREHDEGRQYTMGFRSAAERMKDGDDAAVVDIVDNVYDYVSLLREHINKEDNVLFPMAQQVIPAAEMQSVARAFDEKLAEDEKSGRTAKYQELAVRLGKHYRVASSA